MRFLPGLFVVAAGLWAADPAATILGTVRDPSGAGIPGVRAVARNVETGFEREGRTNAEGVYVLPLLPAGRYTVTIEAASFKKYVREGVTLVVNQNARVDAALALGAVTESVNVRADAVMVETYTGALKEVVDPARMQNLPLNGRDVLQFQFLLPGVTPSTTETQALTGPFVPVSASVNGARAASNNYLLDGGNATDQAGGGLPAPFPHPDALQEFSILSNAYSAEYGKQAGATVNAVTRSGTNQFHGSAFNFLRNEKLNTRSFFAGTRPVYKQNQFGFTLGGPVLVPQLFNGKDKLFFFASYQGTRIRRAPTQSSALVPNEQERRGDFSRTTPVPTDPTTRAPFPGNAIPASRIDPAAARILEKWVPLPNRPNGQYVFNRPAYDDTDQFVSKIDHQMSARNRLSGRYLYQWQTYRRFQGNLPDFYGDKLLRHQNALVNDTHTFRPNLLNDFRAAYVRYRNSEFPTSGQSYADVGINAFLKPPNFVALSVSGWFSPSVRRPSNEIANTYQLSDTMTWLRGRHQLKFGVEILHEQFNSVIDGAANPEIGFDGSASRNPYGDFLLGLPNMVSQSSGNEFGARRYYTSLFVQDDIKVGPRLTLNVGLRYDPLWPSTDNQNRMSAYRPGQQSSRFRRAPAGLVFPGDPGISDATFASDRNNFAPRFGFAWDPTGSGRWSLRGGYGWFYDLQRIIAVGQFTSQQPWNLAVQLFAPGSLADPYRGRANPFPFSPPVTAEQQRDYPFTLPIIADVISPDFRSAYMQQWNFSVQREAARDFLVTAAYAGSKGTQLHYNLQINPAVYGTGATVANTNQRRPLFPNYASLSENRSGANSTYHSFQASLNKRYSRGYTILASYTWSKSIDTISTGREGQFRRVPNPYNLNAYRGVADFDYPHRFVASFLWELPAFREQKGVAGKILGGWNVNGISTLQSGTPFSPLSGTDRSFTAVGGDQADLIGNPHLGADRPRGDRIRAYFDAAAFAPAAAGTFGTAGRNILRGFGTVDFTFAFTKNTRLFESHSIEYRTEFFNIMNRPTFGLPEARQNNRAFGQVLSAGDGRVAQMVLKYAF